MSYSRFGGHEFHQESRSIVVAHARSTARAEFVVATLAAHGITATLTASSIYPSIDFVEGRGISVQLDQQGRARDILEALGLEDDPPNEATPG